MMAEVKDTTMPAKEPSPTREAPRAADNPEPNTAALVAKSAGDNLEDELAELNGKDEEGPGLDELSSLEQEIAKLHSIPSVDSATEAADAACAGIGGSDSGGADARAAGDDRASGTPQLEDGHDASGNGQASTSSLEEVDLIALLKGTDTSHEPAAPGNEKCELEKALSELDSVEADVGVTIEGEGQYEIMEIDDDESNGGESSASKAIPKLPVSKSSKTSSSSAASGAFGKPKLSAEQARAVALEQMADLKNSKSRRKEFPPVSAVQGKPKDIVSSLNEDWDDYEDSEEEAPAPPPVATKVVVPAKKLPGPSKPAPAPTPTPSVLTNKISAFKVMLKPVTQKQIAASHNTAVVERPMSATTVLPVAKESAEPATGCKRVIKRKIIWDPDAPETQKSFAMYASSSSSKGTATPSTPGPAAAAPPPSTPKTAKPPPPPTPKSAKPTVKNVSSISMVKKEPAIKKPLRAPTPTVRATKSATPVGAAERGPSPAKRRSQTPVSGLVNGGGPQKKRKVTEIDRLMGDEGAANMIQAVEHEQREMSGGETSSKPLRKRAMTITGRNQLARSSVEPPMATPKKESAPPSTPKSNAKRTSSAAAYPKTPRTPAVSAVFTKTTPRTVQPRASDSWDFVYKQRASEESMIMRERSNSSFSSKSSVSRLSLDNKPGGAATLSDDAAEGSDPSFKFLKPVNKANQRGREPSPACSSSHTLANDMKAYNSGQTKAAASEMVVLHKVDKVAHLVIHTHRGKSGHTYSSQLLHKLTETLNNVARNNEFNTVLITSQGQQFCQGINCQELVQGSAEKRRNSASQLSQALKTYLCTLATFPKPLVAGIVGRLFNLGVMQLPLADFVVAADDCCFETNYAKLGQLPEGYALWHGHKKVSSQVDSHLLLLGERLFARDVLGPNSFVDKTCQARRVGEEAMAVARHISTTSAETYRTLKKLNHTPINAAKYPRLDDEFKVIAEQWASSNCLANFKRYLSSADF